MSNTPNVATIEVEFQLNLALLEYASQVILERYNLDVSMFSAQELVDAWASAIKDHMKAWAQDTDHFLSRNGTEEKFLNALLEA